MPTAVSRPAKMGPQRSCCSVCLGHIEVDLRRVSASSRAATVERGNTGSVTGAGVVGSIALSPCVRALGGRPSGPAQKSSRSRITDHDQRYQRTDDYSHVPPPNRGPSQSHRSGASAFLGRIVGTPWPYTGDDGAEDVADTTAGWAGRVSWGSHLPAMALSYSIAGRTSWSRPGNRSSGDSSEREPVETT